MNKAILGEVIEALKVIESLKGKEPQAEALKGLLNFSAPTQQAEEDEEDDIQEFIPKKAQITLPQTQVMPYSSDYFVLQNKLLNAVSSLNLLERRLIIHLASIVRETVSKDPKCNQFDVRVIDFINEFNIKDKNIYQQAKELSCSIEGKSIRFWDFDENGVIDKSKRFGWLHWVIGCCYEDGVLTFELHPIVIRMLTVFNNENAYTKYQINMIVNLNTYAISLYELLISQAYKKDKQITYTIEYLREKLDCVNRYANISDFRRYVLDNTINEINKHTDIEVTKYDFVKESRKVKAVTFYYHIKPEIKTIEKNTPVEAQNKPLSAKQANYFGSILSQLTVENTANLSDLAGSLSKEEFADKLASILEKPSEHKPKTVEKVFKALFEHTDYKQTGAKR